MLETINKSKKDMNEIKHTFSRIRINSTQGVSKFNKSYACECVSLSTSQYDLHEHGTQDWHHQVLTPLQASCVRV